MDWHDAELKPKVLQHSTAFFLAFRPCAAVKIECKMSHLIITFDRYAFIAGVLKLGGANDPKRKLRYTDRYCMPPSLAVLLINFLHGCLI